MALTLCRWILNIVGNPVCLPLQGHNRKSTEKVQKRVTLMKKGTEQLPEKRLDRQGHFGLEKRHFFFFLTEL